MQKKLSLLSLYRFVAMAMVLRFMDTDTLDFPPNSRRGDATIFDPPG